MLKKLFTTRSPFWQLLIYSLFFFVAFLTIVRQTGDNEPPQLNNILTLIAVTILIILSGIYTVQVFLYNRKYPKNPIRYYGFLPPELKEEDEGMRMFTARATRRVYIFHATLIPIFAILCVYLLPSHAVIVAGLAILVIGHYGIYLATIWPVLGEDDNI